MIGIGLGLPWAALGGGATFNPLTLFGGGEQGFILDMLSATAISFQERTGSGATTPSGDAGTLGSLKDLSPNGNWLTASADGTRPLFFTNGFTDCDGVDDLLKSSAITLNQPVTRIASWRNRGAGSGFAAFLDGNNTNHILGRNGSLTVFATYSGSFLGALTVATNEDAVTTEISNGASSKFAKNFDAYTTGNAGAVNPGGLSLGARGNASEFSQLRLYRLIEINRVLSDAEIASCRTWCGKTAALSTPLIGWGDSLSAGNTWYQGAEAQSMSLGTRYPRLTVVQGASGQNSTQIKDRMVGDATYNSGIQVIWVGRNDINNPAQTVASSTILANVALMVAAAQARSNKYIVLSVTNANLNAPGTLLANSEASGTSIHSALISMHATLASTYGSNYLDIRSLLVAKGLTGDANDQADAAADVPPRSLMADDIHYLPAGYAFIGRQIETKAESLGY